MQALSDLPILQELGIPIYALRAAEPKAPSSPNHDFVVVVEEAETDFSAAHHEQLQKIMTYLGQTPQQYRLCHAEGPGGSIQNLLVFGKVKLEAQTRLSINTQSISEMLKNPACKRQVLNDLQPLKS